jgi:hypothetical protein
MDSGLGESYGSLTNVQLPSWNHADFRGIRTNEDRVVTASRSLARYRWRHQKVTDYSIRSTGGRADFQTATFPN